jgi:hypothetical protein
LNPKLVTVLRISGLNPILERINVTLKKFGGVGAFEVVEVGDANDVEDDDVDDNTLAPVLNVRRAMMNMVVDVVYVSIGKRKREMPRDGLQLTGLTLLQSINHDFRIYHYITRYYNSITIE